MKKSNIFVPVILCLIGSILFGFTTYKELPLEENHFIDHSVKEILPLLKFADKENPEVFQIFAHGKSGQLLINNEWKAGVELGIWLKKVIPEGIEHVNIYGCNFARGPRGEAAVAHLEWVLDVSIAASDDITGRDGDWELEFGNPISAIRLPNYEDNLFSD